MPNWCMNSATIRGTKEQIDALIAAAEKDEMLEYLAPIGEWDYGKAIDTWGTKWEPHDIGIDGPHKDDGDYYVHINFDSAWGPPVEAYVNAEENLGLKISGSYYEPGMCFVGLYDMGENNSYEVDFSDAHWEEDIPSDLVSEWGLDYEYEMWKEWQDEEEDA